MALQLLAANNAQSVLAAGISSSATTLILNTGTGILFPSPVSGTSFFKLTLIDAATGQISEIVHVTARSGDSLTIVRAQEGTAARAWSANDIAANMMTAGTLSYIIDNFAQTSSLGAAAFRGVWGGGGDLTAAGGFSLGVGGAFKLPTGTIVQWDEGVTASGGFTKNYPVPFPNQCLVLTPVVYSTLGSAYSVLANKSSKTQANFNVVNTSGSGISGISAGYIAIGY